VYCANLLGNAGRNAIYGPKFVNVDFSLLKNFAVPRVSEAFNIQFRAEFFNILNHLNYNSPDDANILFDQTGASTGPVILDQQAGTSRQIQFALKLIF
jgi:hypothetical protein